jgi:hypothetical protein
MRRRKINHKAGKKPGKYVAGSCTKPAGSKKRLRNPLESPSHRVNGQGMGPKGERWWGRGMRNQPGRGRRPKPSDELRKRLPELLQRGAESYGFRGDIWTNPWVALTVRWREKEVVVYKVFRIIVFTLSMYIVTHLFVLVTLPFAILISYFDIERIPTLKQWFVKSLFAIIGKK